MSRVTRSSISAKDAFISFFDLHENRFSIWIGFVENATRLLGKKLEDYEKKIIEFDLNHSTMAGMDGIDHYYGDIMSYSSTKELVLPLAFIGAYNHFERYFKNYYNELLRFNEIGIATALSHKDMYIDQVEKKLKENVIDVNTHEELKKSWERIGDFKELRNVLAHNDNPVNGTDSQRLEKLKRIKCLEISPNHYVSMNFDVVKNSCALYDQFITDLTTKIADTKFSSS